MYIRESFVLLFLCAVGVLSRPTDVGVGSCESKASELLGESQDYSALDDDGGVQEAECADPKARADKEAEKKDRKEADAGSEQFQETGLAGDGDSGVDERESRYEGDDYQACDSKAMYEDADGAKYRDAFGGFPQDSGRGKRVKRSFFYH